MHTLFGGGGEPHLDPLLIGIPRNDVVEEVWVDQGAAFASENTQRVALDAAVCEQVEDGAVDCPAVGGDLLDAGSGEEATVGAGVRGPTGW